MPDPVKTLRRTRQARGHDTVSFSVRMAGMDETYEEPIGFSVRMAGMDETYEEPIEVTTREREPEDFWWRDDLYRVVAVLDVWWVEPTGRRYYEVLSVGGGAVHAATIRQENDGRWVLESVSTPPPATPAGALAAKPNDGEADALDGQMDQTHEEPIEVTMREHEPEDFWWRDDFYHVVEVLDVWQQVPPGYRYFQVLFTGPGWEGACATIRQGRDGAWVLESVDR